MSSTTGADATTNESENVLPWNSVAENMDTEISRAEKENTYLLAERKFLKEQTFQNGLLLKSLKSEIEAKRASNAELNRNKLQAETKLQSLVDVVAELKSKIEDIEEERFNILDTFNDDVEVLSSKFLTAPAHHEINKVSADIDTYAEEIRKVEDQIKTQCDPEILKLDSMIAEEPVTRVDIAGLSPRDYTATELSILVSNIKENAQNFQKQNEDLRKKIEELRKKEDTL